MMFVLCKFSDHVLNLYQVYENTLNGVKIYGVNTKLKNTKGNNSAKLQME